MKKHFLSGFKSSQDGVAYLEFAICLPVLIIMLMGAIEMTRFIIITQKVEKTAFTLSDIISQGKTISTSDLDKMMYAASQVMLPYTMAGDGRVVVSSVKQDNSVNSLPTIQWQYVSQGANGSWAGQTSQLGAGGTNATPGSTVILPGNLTLNDQDNVVVTEVFYNYQPLIASNGVIPGRRIYKVSVFKPRLGDLSTLSSLQILLQGAYL